MSASINPEIQKTDVKTDDFAKTVAESKAKIQSEQLKEVKRGRGRPSKSDTILNSASIPQNPQTNPQLGLQPTPPPDISQFLVQPLIGLSKPWALKNNCPELALTSEEALACAQSLNACLNAFVPDMNQMSPKTAAVLGLFTTVGAIGFTKYSIYQEKVSSQKAKEIKRDQEIVDESRPTQVEHSIDANNYFRK